MLIVLCNTTNNKERKLKAMNTTTNRETEPAQALENALAALARSYGDTHINRLKREIELSDEFRKKHDGGARVSELQLMHLLIDSGDTWGAFTTFYNLAYRRGYRAGEKTTKERLKTKQRK